MTAALSTSRRSCSRPQALDFRRRWRDPLHTLLQLRELFEEQPAMSGAAGGGRNGQERRAEGCVMVFGHPSRDLTLRPDELKAAAVGAEGARCWTVRPTCLAAMWAENPQGVRKQSEVETRRVRARRATHHDACSARRCTSRRSL